MIITLFERVENIMSQCFYVGNLAEHRTTVPEKKIFIWEDRKHCQRERLQLSLRVMNIPHQLLAKKLPFGLELGNDF